MLNNKVKILLVSFVHHIELQYFLIAPPRRIRWHTSTQRLCLCDFPQTVYVATLQAPAPLLRFVVNLLYYLLVCLLAGWCRCERRSRQMSTGYPGLTASVYNNFDDHNKIIISFGGICQMSAGDDDLHCVCIGAREFQCSCSRVLQLVLGTAIRVFWIKMLELMSDPISLLNLLLFLFCCFCH